MRPKPRLVLALIVLCLVLPLAGPQADAQWLPWGDCWDYEPSECISCCANWMEDCMDGCGTNMTCNNTCWRRWLECDGGCYWQYDPISDSGAQPSPVPALLEPPARRCAPIQSFPASAPKPVPAGLFARTTGAGAAAAG